MSEDLGTATIYDVAKYITRLVGKPDISQIKLYKLLWFCQGWHYNLTGGKPLFDDPFEAWEHGPVPRRVWEHFKGRMHVSEEDFDIFKCSTKNISAKSKEIIDLVLKHYGDLTPSNLRALSHECEPWKKYSRQFNQLIPNEEISSYFCQLK